MNKLKFALPQPSETYACVSLLRPTPVDVLTPSGSFSLSLLVRTIIRVASVWVSWARRQHVVTPVVTIVAVVAKVSWVGLWLCYWGWCSFGHWCCLPFVVAIISIPAVGAVWIRTSVRPVVSWLFCSVGARERKSRLPSRRNIVVC